MNLLSRRSVIVGSAAVVTAIPAVGLAKALPQQSSELATLVQRYFAEVDHFNIVAITDDRTDEQNDALAEATYYRTEHEMERTPVRTPQDALAILDYFEREDVFGHYCGEMNTIIGSLVGGLRAYLCRGAG